MKYIIYLKNIFKLFVLKLRQLDERETTVLVNNMPEWYLKYQYGLFSRCCRVIACFLMCSTWYNTYLLAFFKKINFNIIFLISAEMLLSIYGILVFFSLIFLFFHCIFNVIIRIYFFKKIVKNSPISFAQCISTGMKVCRYSIYGLGVIFGVPGVDYLFESNGHVRPFRSFYMKRQIEFFEANSINCALSEGEKLTKDGILKSSIRYLQDKTEWQEIIVNSAYNSAKDQQNVNVTEVVIKALSDN